MERLAASPLSAAVAQHSRDGLEKSDSGVSRDEMQSTGGSQEGQNSGGSATLKRGVEEHPLEGDSDGKRQKLDWCLCTIDTPRSRICLTCMLPFMFRNTCARRWKTWLHLSTSNAPLEILFILDCDVSISSHVVVPISCASRLCQRTIFKSLLPVAPTLKVFGLGLWALDESLRLTLPDNEAKRFRNHHKQLLPCVVNSQQREYL